MVSHQMWGMSWDQHSSGRFDAFGASALGSRGIVRSSGGAGLWDRECFEEMPRADAARLAGMDRQTLRDAVVRYNAKGLEGLPRPSKGLLAAAADGSEEAALGGHHPGPEPERDGVCAWTRADLCRWLEERFAKTYHPSSMTRVLRRMGFSPEGAPEPPAKGRPKRRSSSKKGASRHPEGDRRGASRQAPQLWFQDEARVGNKGRVCHRWWRRGERAPGTRQIGYQWAYIFSAVRPDTGDEVTLVMPSVNAKVMDLFPHTSPIPWTRMRTPS